MASSVSKQSKKISRPRSNLEAAIRKFLPKELIPETWQCDARERKNSIQDLLNQANGQLGMFESADDLYDQIATYIDFPKSYEYLKMPAYDIVDSSLSILDTMSKKWCMYECDLHKLLYYCDSCPLECPAKNSAEMILNRIWKRLRVESHHEMILFTEKPKQPTSAHPDLRAFGTAGSKSEYEDFKDAWKEDKEKTIYGLTDFILEEMDIFLMLSTSKDYQEAADIVSWVGYVMEEVAKFCKDKNIYMKQLNPNQKTRKPKQVIRLFSNEKGEFVMAHDFLQILQEYGVDSDKIEKLIPKKLRQEVAYLPTLSYEDVLRALETSDNKELKNLEFAMMESPRLMFARSPIPTCKKGYCILAMDALYEVMMDMIVAKKVFQENDSTRIKKFFESIKTHFDIKKDIYFIDSEMSEAIMKEWEKFYNQHLKREDPSNAKSNAKTIKLKKKFDLKYLTKTLRFLKLNEFFKGIEEYAYPIFAKLKKKSPRDPSDLHAAVTQCQINCLAREVPWILKFIEKQNSRNRMNIVDFHKTKYVASNLVELDQMGTSEKKQEAKGNVSTKKNTKKK
ncbi:hypothetical protein GCK72_020817 [Caenorhabditis remanei]|uniref:Uncharacterized protein n=1 Tax=Caenorhabditis remanei TaxID=31234 RepID=A0A6A5GGB1_CAERE|nr:hypothetical protein GCK72_020817 [Caenorhabditis remanei]KAF1754257.1 hypothetical protein GCK72_020817 [Caenorhabditis remanei]